jgi:hypothetical protein
MREFFLQRSIRIYAAVTKDFAGELFVPHYFIRQGGVRPVSTRSEPNDLEDPKNRRSAGRHGNQHVRLRRPQVSGCDSFGF